MALISPQSMAVTGTSPTFSAPSASDTLVPNERGVYLVRTTGTATTVVFDIPGNDSFGQAKPNVSNTLGATDIKAFPTIAYIAAADATTGTVTITHSGALTGVTSAYILI